MNQPMKVSDNYGGTSVNPNLPDMTDKLQVLEDQIIPQFFEAYRKIGELAERVGYSLPPSSIQEHQGDTAQGHLGHLGKSMDTLRGLGDSLNGLLDELTRFI